MFRGHDDLLIGSRRGSPLAVGHGEGEMYLGSDAIALAPFTRTITYLEEGDSVILTRTGASFYDAEGQPVERLAQETNASTFLVDKAGHRHFMSKEIAEPEVIAHTLAHYLDLSKATVRLPAESPVERA